MIKKYINRKLEKRVEKLSEKYPIITILGPRQSGKTTMLRQMYPDYHYVTLESPDTRLMVQNDPRGFLLQYKNKPIIIDEFQRFPELTSYLQEYADSVYEMGQIFLTGSQQFNISEKISQSLAGRTGILKLLPLSLQEIINVYPILTLEEMMIKGSYPAIYDRDMTHLEWYPSYVETYLERDIRQLVNVGNLDKFLLFLGLLAGRTGQLLNMNNVSIEAGITQPTAKQWLSILLTSQLTFILQPLHKNINKRMIKTPKLYFTDTGLLCHLLRIRSLSDLQVHPLRSSIFENFIVSEFYKYKFYNQQSDYNMLYYRDTAGREVDLIIEQASDIKLFEIKYTHTLRHDFYKHMKYVQNKIPIKSADVIYAGHQRFPDVLNWSDMTDIQSWLES